MARIKKFKLGGLDLKSNDLIRDGLRASDLRNVQKSQKGDIVQRFGYATQETIASTEAVAYYKTGDEEVLIKTDGTIVKSYNILTYQDITYFAKLDGIAGSRISVRYGSGATAGAEVVTVTYFPLTDIYTIVVSIQSGVSTATQVITALQLSDSFKLVCIAGITGTAATAQVTSTESPLVFTRKDVTTASVYPNSLDDMNRVVTCEHLNNLYITTNDGKTPVVKYDSSYAYLAGLPAPIGATISASAATGYTYRCFYSMDDCNGNRIYGPYLDLVSSIATATITFNTFKNSANAYGRFYDKYTVAALGPIVLGGAGKVSTVTITGTNHSVGDKIIAYGTSSGVPSFQFLRVTLTILKITGGGGAGTIYFGLTDMPIGWTGNMDSLGLGESIDTSVRFHVYQAPLNVTSYGFKKVFDALSPTTIIERPVNNNAVSQSYAVLGVFSNDFFEDIYNTVNFHLRPPLCKYLTVFGDQLVFGNIIGSWVQDNSFSVYNNNDIIIYSDVDNGSGPQQNGENNSEDIQKIGDSHKGEVTGLSRVNDILLVTKTNGIYALDGDLTPGGYSLRKIPTNYIGCLSHNSIVQVEKGVMFLGNDGIYITDGVSAKKLTDKIDPFFGQPSLAYGNVLFETCRSVVNKDNEKIFFYMKGTDSVHYIAVYDYDFDEWFIWNTLNASKGLHEKANGFINFSNATSIFNFNTGIADGASITPSYLYSNWEDCGEPSVEKKFLYLRIWNLTSTATTFGLNIQKNWNPVNTYATDLSVTIPAYGSIQKGFDQKTYKSIRFIFNSSGNSSMIISAYEVEFEHIQKIDKGN